MYEFQVDRLTKELAQDWLQYLDEAYGREMYKTGINQLRTIPVEKSIPIPENIHTNRRLPVTAHSSAPKDAAAILVKLMIN